jgi:hypothetical protein
MSSSSNMRAPEPTGKSKRKTNTIDLPTARQMLPLVRSIVQDIVDQKRRLTDLVHEQYTLDRERRSLTWESRRRRYMVAEEVAQTERNYSSAIDELTKLGVALVDPNAGRVDFPTRINGRAAAFSWQVGEDGVEFWRYQEENQRRPIPRDWQPGTAIRPSREA